ncbi:MAG: HNH endonuclease [Gemmatimonadota bacterium]|nr:HNH endonuclease [Gemmatimonadota bacterium]MDH5195664.1 HNH endonuclease [Gemmatimonadota bacterium]
MAFGEHPPTTRQRGTDSHGSPFDDETVSLVWNKGSIISGYRFSEWRRDPCGRIIRRLAYGDIASSHGWEVDHVKPIAKGGGDELANLQPLHWQLNWEKGDRYPWECP